MAGDDRRRGQDRDQQPDLQRTRPGDCLKDFQDELPPVRLGSPFYGFGDLGRAARFLPSFQMVFLRYYLGAICTTSEGDVVSLWLSALHSPPLGVMTGDAALTGTGMCRRER